MLRVYCCLQCVKWIRICMYYSKKLLEKINVLHIISLIYSVL